MESVRSKMKILLRELFKHAQKNDCYECKKILREMGLDPEKECPI